MSDEEYAINIEDLPSRPKPVQNENSDKDENNNRPSSKKKPKKPRKSESPQSKSESELKEGEFFCSQYLNEKNEYNKKFQKMLRIIEEEVRETIIAKKRKDSLIINPDIIELTPQWKDIFSKHELIPDYDVQKLDIFAKDFKKYEIKTPTSIEDFLNEIDVDSREISEDIIEKIQKNCSIRHFFQKKTTLSLDYFCIVFGYVYLEQLVTEKKPFKSLLEFIKMLKGRNLQLISPENLSFSLNEDQMREIEKLPKYMLDKLIELSEKLLFRAEEAFFQAYICDFLQNFFNDNKLLMLVIARYITTEIFEYCKEKNKQNKFIKNLLDTSEKAMKKNIKILCEKFLCKLNIYDLDQNKHEILGENLHEIKINAKLVIYEKNYYFLYSERKTELFFPKIFEKIEEKKKKNKKKDKKKLDKTNDSLLCQFCKKKEGKQRGKCKHNYCKECLINLVSNSNTSFIKCKSCGECVGNKANFEFI